MLTRTSGKLLLVLARGECTPTKPQRKRVSRFCSSAKHGSSVSVFRHQSRGKCGVCLMRAMGRGITHAAWTEYISTSFLLCICFCLSPPIVVVEGKKGSRIKPDTIHFTFCFFFFFFKVIVEITTEGFNNDLPLAISVWESCTQKWKVRYSWTMYLHFVL